MEVESLTASTPSLSGARSAEGLTELGSAEFLQLLIAQITHQDPLEPMGNAELLDQLSSIREIELSATLTQSLRELAGQDRFASASSLIGKHISSLPGPDGLSHRGIVVGVRFTEQGKPLLQLSDGSEVPVGRVLTIEPPVQAAEALVGQTVVGLDRRELGDPKLVEGLVTAIRVESHGEVFLELDTGGDLRFRDVMGVTSSQ